MWNGLYSLLGRHVGVLPYFFPVVLIFGLWIYYDVRDRKLIDDKRRRGVFHCIRCDKLYSAPEGVEVCQCPRCKFENSRLRF